MYAIRSYYGLALPRITFPYLRKSPSVALETQTVHCPFPDATFKKIQSGMLRSRKPFEQIGVIIRRNNFV